MREMDTESPVVWPAWCYSGDTPSTDPLENSPPIPSFRSSTGGRRRRFDRSSGVASAASTAPIEFALHSTSNASVGAATQTSITVNSSSANGNSSNSNNVGIGSSSSSSSSSTGTSAHHQQQVKNERLSPGTPDTSSRSRSVTPSSASHPDTPPASEQTLAGVGTAGLTASRNYSDFMRSLAAKYNNANPNDYFCATRNGFSPALDSRFKQTTFPNLIQNLNSSIGVGVGVGAAPKEEQSKKPPDFSSILNPFTPTSMFPPLIDMSTTQTLLAMVRTAKEAELQGLLKTVKRQESSSPLDLSAGAVAAPLPKRPRTKTPSTAGPVASMSSNNIGNGSSSVVGVVPKRAGSESPRLHEDVSSWSVDDVCSFVSSIDICAEYAQTFREQRIDGAGLPLLTEEHMTSTMNMKLGPALKLKSILAKKLGSCSICLHCSHCHRNNSGSPDIAGSHAGNTSDSGEIS